MKKIRIVGIKGGKSHPFGLGDTWDVRYRYVESGMEHIAKILKSEAVDELAAYKQFVNNLSKRVDKFEVVTDE